MDNMERGKKPMIYNEILGWETSSSLPSHDVEVGSGVHEEVEEVVHEEVEEVEASVKVEPVDKESVEPTVGMTFCSEDEAYAFYNAYAKRKGFSIKKYHVERRRDGSLKFRKFTCSKQGMRQVHRTHVTKKPRPETRTNCMARCEFKIDKNSIWTLSKFESNHNHSMTSPNKVQYLRSHRKIQPFQRDLIDKITESGMDAHHIFNYLKSGLSNNEVGFTRDDGCRKKILNGMETRGILKYLKDRRAKDYSFFYAIDAKESGEITNFFWVDGKSIVDYAYFGDVIYFDTTFQTTDYDMSFALIVGINHHKQTIMFGAALLFDDTADSFIWLFETFLQAMNGRQPQTIFTDQSDAISKAVQVVMPNTAHRLCVWHIFNNAVVNLSHVIHCSSRFHEELKHIVYERCSVEEFETLWHDLLSKYNLHENSWMTNFYKVREKWAACYRVETFCADLTTTQYSKSVNSHFKSFFGKKPALFDFLTKYDKAVSCLREKELKADFQSRNSRPSICIGNMLREAASVYTRVIYEELAAQFDIQLDCLIQFIGSDNDVLTYKISPPNGHRAELVKYIHTTMTVYCTCKLFESNGILCMHAMKVLLAHNVHSIPKQYILKRWTKYAAEGDGFNSCPVEFDESGKESLSSIYNRVCLNQHCISIMSINSRKALEHVEHATKQLRLQVEKILRIDCPDEELVAQINEEVYSSPNITIRPAASKKELKEKRKKSVLEKRPKKTDKSNASCPTATRAPTMPIPPDNQALTMPMPFDFRPHNIPIHDTHTQTQIPPDNRAPIMPMPFDFRPLNVPIHDTHTQRPIPPYWNCTSLMTGATSFYCSDKGSRASEQNQSGE